MNGIENFYRHLSDQDLAFQQMMIETHRTIVANEMARRLASSTGPLDYSRLFSTPPPVTPTPEEKEEEWTPVCKKPQCKCRYYFGADKTVPLIDFKTLFVRGIDTSKHFQESRHELMDILSNNGKAVSDHIRVIDGEPIAYVNFKTHEQAVLGQQLLEENGYFANFLRKSK